MPDFSEKINLLQARLDKMVEYQVYFYREINQIRDELTALRTGGRAAESFRAPSNETTPSPITEKPISQTETNAEAAPRPPVERIFASDQPIHETANVSAKSVQSSGIEEFVGRNLISLIGIIITILGVGIGAKYAIDRDLISPTTRILLGYAFAAVLIAVAVWLKKNYLNFSAVLLSGALAIMYFLTFFAYSFYALVPQPVAFALMLLITAFSVAAAMNYNRQVIAHVGLVGAYAVPFLLSENSGRADVLFGYMTIINFGILAISVFKFWKPLYYSSFIFTWLIYAAWFLSSYRGAEQFALAFGFAAVFFLTFYLTFLSYKLIAKEEFNAEIVGLVLVNSFIFYGFGYQIFDSSDNFRPFLGAFTLFNALLNFLVAFVIHKYELGDRKNFYLAMALAVAFVTIAVPVQFSGNWITLIWTAEAAALFWIGRTKRLGLYENLAYPLMILATISLTHDWQNAFNNEAAIAPILNRGFLTAILFAAAFGLIAFVNRDERYESSFSKIASFINFAVPTVFLFVLYNAFRIEIGNYYQQRIVAGIVETADDAMTRKDGSLPFFNILWQTNYSMLFLALLSFVNIKRIKSEWLGLINLALNASLTFVFLLIGLFLLGELRTLYLTQSDADVFPRGVFYVLFRYVCFACVAWLIYASHAYVKQEFTSRSVSKSVLDSAFDFVFYFALLCIVSSELINVMDIFGYNDSYKLGLSILWGLYALALIVVGIVKRKAQLRIGAIALFAVTLVKLFFYDIADLDTISKTVVFLSLGVLLLIISFLYNKYKDLIFERNAG